MSKTTETHETGLAEGDYSLVSGDPRFANHRLITWRCGTDLGTATCDGFGIEDDIDLEPVVWGPTINYNHLWGSVTCPKCDRTIEVDEYH